MDDDDDFLYGDSNKETPAPVQRSDIKAVVNGSTQPAAESRDEENGEAAMDEEESDSDIEITLEADPNAPPPQPAQFRPHYPTYIRQPGTVQPTVSHTTADLPQKPADVPVLRPPAELLAGATPPPMTLTASGLPKPEFEQPAIVDDGDLLLDVDIDDLPDQPWRRAGAVVSEYFNYGFDEATWKAYCAKQKVSREDRENERSESFSVFATLPLQEAWDSLSMESRTALMNTIASSFASSMPNGTDAMASGSGVKSEQFDDAGAMSPRSQAGGSSSIPTGPAANRRPAIPVKPESIPTGPKSALLGPRTALPTGPRNASSYRDQDPGEGSVKEEDLLDYGNERAERDDHSPKSSRSRSERDRDRRRDRDRDDSEDDDRRSKRSRRDDDRDREKDDSRSERRHRSERERSPTSSSKRRSRDEKERDERPSRSSRDKERSSRVAEAFGDDSEEDHRSSKRSKR